ncbi:MAG: pseudaminic acid biosynthesis-associated methylase [Verrucomicrobiae bacterium]|nr:pseudaminic acid biosynthesis-associated methylase [Verrucomicrobiae bacterium]
MTTPHYSTEQEAFWAGEFGDQYVNRNSDAHSIANNIVFFSRIFSKINSLTSAIEFGANIGLNVAAIKHILPDIHLDAVEINPSATKILREKNTCSTVFNESILTFESENRYELTFTKGVLIHIAPEKLPEVYDKLFTYSKKYILIAEYYNPTPTTVTYRGHREKLFKRDFAGEMLDRYDSLRLADYGFIYRRDIFPQDDLTWFLLERR